MYIKNSHIAFVYRLLLTMLCALSIVSHFSLTDHAANSKMLAYFTVQSTIFVFVVFIPVTIYTFFEIKDHNVPFYRYKLPTLRGMATLAILVTFLSYQFMLKDTGFTMYSYRSIYSFMKDNLVHFVIPLMTILDWILFSPKGLFKWYDCLLWLLYPLCYLGYILFRGLTFPPSAFVNIPKWPYFFLNVDKLGLQKVLIIVCIYIVFILGLGLLIYFMDKLFLLLGNKLQKLSIRLHRHQKEASSERKKC